jgi:hypothetical protein
MSLYTVCISYFGCLSVRLSECNPDPRAIIMESTADKLDREGLDANSRSSLPNLGTNLAWTIAEVATDSRDYQCLLEWRGPALETWTIETRKNIAINLWTMIQMDGTTLLENYEGVAATNLLLLSKGVHDASNRIDEAYQIIARPLQDQPGYSTEVQILERLPCILAIYDGSAQICSLLDDIVRYLDDAQHAVRQPIGIVDSPLFGQSGQCTDGT